MIGLRGTTSGKSFSRLSSMNSATCLTLGSQRFSHGNAFTMSGYFSMLVSSLLPFYRNRPPDCSFV
ncbi:hypothetical protein KC19_5G120200 [Ceratodon purpureus]|uniref:Uncharacterized protein n=1 Tax=Ceratodon purpureus TaxID=3225 RepID=A0A8T0I1Z7_CERPU|nr:hypothetical protein KC19_5G120200 [Ceratodon purpureus]